MKIKIQKCKIQLPFELKEIILLYTNDFGLNAVFNYTYNMKIIKNNADDNYGYGSEKLILSVIKHHFFIENINQYINQSISVWSSQRFLIQSIKYKNVYWINEIIKHYKYSTIKDEIMYLIIYKGDIDLFKKCFPYSSMSNKYVNKFKNKGLQNKILNIICKKGYVKMLDYFVKEHNFEILPGYLDRAIRYKRKNIIKYFVSCQDWQRKQ